MRRNKTWVRLIAGLLVALMVAGLLISVVASSTTDSGGTGTVTADDAAALAGDESTEAPPADAAGPTPVPPAEPAPTPTTPPAAAPTAIPTATATPFPDQGPSGLPAVSFADLPPEAVDTLLLIDEGGPFPFSQDGSEFQNREGRLPDEPRGYYEEFTVIMPGSPDRGPLRIVTGSGGEIYWTDDHYLSFSEVVDW